MLNRKPRRPSYRYHKARNCAVVTIHGRDYYLGQYDSDESWERYYRLMAEQYPVGKQSALPSAECSQASLTVNELMLRYMTHARAYYIKDGVPTSEVDNIRQALCFLWRPFGSTPASEFSPLRLKAVRQAMIDHPITRKTLVKDPVTGLVMKELITGQPKTEEHLLRRGLARKHINKQVARIRRMFAWAVEEELVAVTVHEALLRVKGLRKGKSSAREKPRVKPVPRAFVDLTLPYLPKMIQTMVEVQFLADMRPQEVVLMRSIDIDMSGHVWEYRPHRYKTEHRNDDSDPDQKRVVFLGPRVQALLKPYLTMSVTGYLFTPGMSEELRRGEQRRNRKTPLYPSHSGYQEKRRSCRKPLVLRESYDVASYRRAIARACQKAGISVWSPNQLRHSRSTEIRKRFGLEASKACAGHREIGVTQHYAEQDHQLACRVMAEIG